MLFFLAALPQKITSLRPEPDDASPLVYNTPSFITLPITVKLKDIENQTNTFKWIYEDNDIEDDDIEIRVWKPQSLSKTPMKKLGDRIKTTLPLKVLVKYRIGTKTLGTEFYKTQEFNLNGVVKLTSDVEFEN
jgi:hypothetical protein